MKTAPYIRLILWKAAKAVEQVDRVSISGTGLQVSEFAILEVLLHKGPMPISSIGEKVLLTSGSMTAAVNRLVRKDLVRRLPHPTDGRIHHIHLTSRGADVIKEAFDKHKENLERVTAVLTAKERQTLARLLKKIGYESERILALQNLE